jgi:hypothetical protein
LLAGDASAWPSDFLFTAAADYLPVPLLLCIATRHSTQRRNIRR